MYEPSITIDIALEAMRQFLLIVNPGASIVRGQVNRVAMPTLPVIVMTELMQMDLCRPYITQVNETANKITTPSRLDVQLDFYGFATSEYAQTIRATIMSGWAYDVFPNYVKPMFCSEIIQSAFETGAEQTVNNWQCTISLQYNPVTTVPIETAGGAIATVHPYVDNPLNYA